MGRQKVREHSPEKRTSKCIHKPRLEISAETVGRQKREKKNSRFNH